jgi:multicomponent Na+:H+ antiporter subunit C
MMATLTLVYIAALFGMGVFLLLRRSWFRLAIGVGVIGHAVNLAILLMGQSAIGSAPIVRLGAGASSTSAAGSQPDPLPQALILTAIVIGFAMQAYLMLLGVRAAQAQEGRSKSAAEAEANLDRANLDRVGDA